MDAQYLLDPYAAPAIYAAPYYGGYIYGSNRPGGDGPKQSSDVEEKRQQMGFIPNPLDPSNANRQFPPPMTSGHNMPQSGPPAFPSPILQFETTTAPPESKRKL